MEWRIALITQKRSTAALHVQTHMGAHRMMNRASLHEWSKCICSNEHEKGTIWIRVPWKATNKFGWEEAWGGKEWARHKMLHVNIRLAFAHREELASLAIRMSECRNTCLCSYCVGRAVALPTMNLLTAGLLANHIAHGNWLSTIRLPLIAKRPLV